MAEFEVGGRAYRSGKMDTFAQFHVTRKLGPAVAKLAPSIGNVNDLFLPPDVETGRRQVDFGRALAALAPTLDMLSTMSEDEFNYIFDKCLAVVARREGDSYLAIWNRVAKRLQFEDITMPEMVEIVLQVLGDNLGGFFTAKGLTSFAAPSPPPGPLTGSPSQTARTF